MSRFLPTPTLIIPIATVLFLLLLSPFVVFFDLEMHSLNVVVQLTRNLLRSPLPSVYLAASKTREKRPSAISAMQPCMPKRLKRQIARHALQDFHKTSLVALDAFLGRL